MWLDHKERQDEALTGHERGRTMSNELAVQPLLPDVVTLGKLLSGSGYFQDAKQAGQAAVKVLAGQELGFGPIASMTGIYIVKGKVTLSANLIGAAIKKAARYDYRVKHLDNTGCEIEFYQDSKPLGISEFAERDAKQAGLVAGENWKKYPRNMYFARAMSNGAKWFCPDVFGGPVYTPDELGAIVDGETGEIINGEATVVEPEPTGNGDKQAALSTFFDKVLEEIPYYNHSKHVGATLKKMGYDGYNPDNEDAMWADLQAHASEKADEKADEEAD